MTTLFISDLHLSEHNPQLTDLFLAFLQRDAKHAAALYILGDLFEQWIGDDDPNPLNLIVQRALRALVDQGIPVYFMHGNRDFLVGNRFARGSGCQILADPTLLTVAGHTFLLMHGDTLCTKDERYLRFRRKVRNPLLQWVFLHLPLSYRCSTAQRYRSGSQAHQKNLRQELMDVTEDEVIRQMQQHQVTLLLHGHTHRPALHRVNIDGVAANRIVLAAWEQTGNALAIADNGQINMLYFDHEKIVRSDILQLSQQSN